MRFILRSGIVCILAISTLFVASCKRNANVSPDFTYDDEGNYASDASRIELIDNDVISIADAAGTNYNSTYIAACATVATDTVSIPHTLIIRFGNSDCTGLDGKTRSGAIVVTYNGEYSDPNQAHTITFNNYYINGNQLTGSLKVTRIDTTVAGHWYDMVQVNDTLNIDQNTAGSAVTTWNGSLVRRWVSGYTTGDRTDDVFSISGSATLIRGGGNAFVFDIAVPLQFALSCDFAESGIAVVVAPTPGTRSLNYGSGACDPNAQLTLDNILYSVKLTQ